MQKYDDFLYLCFFYTYFYIYLNFLRLHCSPLAKRFFEFLRLPLAKGSSTFLTKPLFPQEREDVAGDAIALPEFWSASGAFALKGWLRVLTQQSCDCFTQ